jgi:hypothetical protein
MKRCAPLTLCLLLLAGSAQGQTDEKNYAKFPTGEGDPDSLTCRPPQPLPNSRLNGPEVCMTNAAWAQYRRDGMDVAADGVHAVPLRGTSGISCNPAALPSGASGPLHMNMKCIEPTFDATHVPSPRLKSGVVCKTEMNCG